MRLRRISHIAEIGGIIAAMLLFCSCEREIEYPEGVDTLPAVSATGTGIVETIYDTPAPTSLVTTTTEETTVTTTVPTETETSVTTVPTFEETTETTTVCDTSFSLSLDDIPDVGISEYRQNTQTTAGSEFVPQTVSTYISGMTASESAATSAAVSEVYSSQTVTTVSSVDEPHFVTELNSDSKQSVDVLSLPESEQLTEGKISAYTGRERITHPYSYTTLSEKDKKLYDMIVSAMLNYDDVLFFDNQTEKYTFNEIFDVYQLIFNDEYRLFYISPTIEYTTDPETGYVKRMKLKYTVTEDEMKKMRNEIYAEAHKILSSVTPEMSDYEIVKHFHDSVIMGCKYNLEAPNPNTLYGCLVEKNALCQAYSRTFTYLCSEVGIESFVVLGVADEPHMWNVVKMDDDYYHIDLTWDDPDRKDNPDSVRYDYFGLTDTRIRELRQLDPYEYKVPEAKGTKYQYYYYNNLIADSVEEAKLLIKAETLRASAEKKSTVQFMCTSREVYDKVVKELFSASGDNVISVLDSVKSEAANPYNTESIYHNSNKNTYTVRFYLDYLD